MKQQRGAHWLQNEKDILSPFVVVRFCGVLAQMRSALSHVLKAHTTGNKLPYYELNEMDISSAFVVGRFCGVLAQMRSALSHVLKAHTTGNKLPYYELIELNGLKNAFNNDNIT